MSRLRSPDSDWPNADAYFQENRLKSVKPAAIPADLLKVKGQCDDMARTPTINKKLFDKILMNLVRTPPVSRHKQKRAAPKK